MKTSVKRLAIFAHFDRDNRIDDYVIYYIEKLKEVCEDIIFVSTSTLSKEELNKIVPYIHKAFLRENIGYDFMSWKVGMDSIANIGDYDELLICNDSVFGPLFPLQETFDFMEKKDCDFWGLTENYDIAYHLQSYFLVFRKRVLESSLFRFFWKKVSPLKEKQDVIHQYEVGLSQTLINHGFRPGVFVSFRPTIYRTFTTLFQNISLPDFIAEKYRKHSLANFLLKGAKASSSLLLNHRRFLRRLNPTHFYWKQCLDSHVPFIKRDLLKDNPANVHIKNYASYIAKHSNYDIDLIKKHIQRLNN